MLQISDILICPVCGGALDRDGRSLVCSGGTKRHTYDVAKEGYVNLLPPGKGKNAHTGDEAAMVRARSAFLSGGAYGPLSDEVARLIETYCGGKKELTIVDSGCGEGYHTCRFVKKLSESGKDVTCAAFDASKHAAAAGAKLAYRSGIAPKDGVGAAFDGFALALFMAGNIFSLPIRDASADAIVSMFAPIAWGENLRMLKKGGILVVAASGEDHLYEMRDVIYDEVIKKSPDILAEDGFEAVGRTSLTYSIALSSSEEIMNLFGMTPFCYKTPRDATERLKMLETLDVTVNTDFFVFRKI